MIAPYRSTVHRITSSHITAHHTFGCVMMQRAMTHELNYLILCVIIERADIDDCVEAVCWVSYTKSNHVIA